MEGDAHYLPVTVGHTMCAVSLSALLAVERVSDAPERARTALDLAALFWPGETYPSPRYCIHIHHQGTRLAMLVADAHPIRKVPAAQHLPVPRLYSLLDLPVTRMFPAEDHIIQVLDTTWIADQHAADPQGASE